MSNEQQSDTTELMLWTVADGEAAGLVAAYQEAEVMATHLRSALMTSGIGSEVATVTATVTDAGGPVVRVDLASAGVVRLVELLAADGRPPPRRWEGPAAGRSHAA